MDLAKSELRRLLKERASQVMEREEKTRGVCKRLVEFFRVLTQAQREGLWGGYSGLPDEISLEGLFSARSSISSNLNFVHPRVNLRGNFLSFWLPGPRGFEKNRWGILEPVEEEGQEVSLSKLKGLLVPGLGFDKEGRRLGRGKGFYDRTLNLFFGLKVGVTFEELLQPEIPAEKHDVKMDFIVTESHVHICDRKSRT